MPAAQLILVLLGFLEITDAEVNLGVYRHNDEYNPVPLLVCVASTLGACVNDGIPQGSLSVMDQNSSAKSANEKTGDKTSFSTNCRQVWIMSKAFFVSKRRLQAIKLACALLVLVLSVAGVQVLLSYVSRDFMTAISKKDAAAYWQLLWRYIGVFVLAIPLSAYYRWTEERLGLLWREWMAQHLIKRRLVPVSSASDTAAH